MEFDMKSLLSNSSIGAIDKDNKTKKLKVTQISVNDLIPSNNNFYSVEEVTTLKDSIEMYGIKQNLTVRSLDNGTYRVIAGHRRRLASLALVEEGKQEYEMIPCSIETHINDIEEELLLIATNATTRQLTDWEKTQQAQRIRELLEEYRKQEKIPGRTREIIAQILQTSPSQIGRMDSISKHLTEGFQEEFKRDNIKVSTAYELSTLPNEAQQEAMEDYKEKGNLSIQDVKEKKAQQKEDTQDNHNDKQEQEQEQDIEDMVLQCEEVEEYKKPPAEEIVQSKPQSISEKVYPTMHEVVSDMSKKELAGFICKRCDGSGFCDFYADCKYSSIDDRTDVCLKWLDMQVQEGKN